MGRASRRFLHVGCGHIEKTRTTPCFASHAWEEVRFDTVSEAGPDIVGSIVTMDGVEDNSFDAIFSSHNLEFLHPHEAPLALGSFFRVLKADGYLVMICPDLQAACKHIAEGRLLEPLYISSLGPVAPMDIVYGFRPAISAGHVDKAHRCGFVRDVLAGELRRAGFQSIWISRSQSTFSLVAIACKAAIPDDALLDIVRQHFPA